MMIPPIKTSPTLFAALTATALLVFQPSLASARTTLQLENGNVLSFSDGSIDMVTGSGELFDVSVVEYGEEVARAEYVRIDATGNLGQADWFVNELVADNLEAVEEVSPRSSPAPPAPVKGRESPTARRRALATARTRLSHPLTGGSLGDGRTISA